MHFGEVADQVGVDNLLREIELDVYFFEQRIIKFIGGHVDEFDHLKSA